MDGLKAILEHHKQGRFTTDKAERLLLVLFDKRRSAVCFLDRLPKDCSVYQYTSAKDCKTCGHYRE